MSWEFVEFLKISVMNKLELKTFFYLGITQGITIQKNSKYLEQKLAIKFFLQIFK